MAGIDFDAFEASMSGDQRDVFDTLGKLFSSYGLDSLVPEVAKMAMENQSAETIAVGLRLTPAYKQRFSANEARIKAGLPVLTEAQYLSTEASYRQVMSAAGLPPGFYDQPSDFTNWIANNVSPTEIQDRITAASDLIHSVDPNVKNQFDQWYSHGDMVAYALDPTRSTALLKQQENAAKVAGTGVTQGVNINQGLAERIGGQDLSDSQIQQGIGQVGVSAQNATNLNAIYGQNVTTDDLTKSTFLNDAESTKKINRLASQERASFSGSGGAATGSFATKPGQV